MEKIVRSLGLGFILMLGIALALPAPGQEEKKPEPKYTGVKTCKMCHSKVKMGGAEFLKWAKAPHAKAYVSLSTDEAKAAATAAGIENPAEAEVCLKCHTTTLEHKDPKKRAEGIGCERCHGPGSLYKKAKVMKDYKASVEAGMHDFKGKTDEETKKNIEKHCRQCHGLEHKDENPFAKEFKFEEMWPKIKHDEETLKKEFPDAFAK